MTTREDDPLSRIDQLPTPRQTAVSAAYKIYADELAAQRKVSMRELEAAGGVGRKTIVKHIRAGHLAGEKGLVNGKEMWLFEPLAVADYLDRLAGLLEQAVRQKRNRPQRVTAPEGFLTLTAAAGECAVSHWTLRDHLARTGIETVQGRHAAKMIREADLPVLQRYFEKIARPKSRRARPVAATARGRQAGGPYFDDFELLWAVLRSQPETSADDLARVTGATNKTAYRWLRGDRVPADEYQGSIIAFFRERFLCRLGPALEEKADEHRAAYMRAYMRERRLSRN